MDCKKCNATMTILEGYDPTEFCDSCAQEVAAVVGKFISDQRIGCAETIYQTDRVIENAFTFIENLCDAAGYYQSSE